MQKVKRYLPFLMLLLSIFTFKNTVSAQNSDTLKTQKTRTKTLKSSLVFKFYLDYKMFKTQPEFTLTNSNSFLNNDLTIKNSGISPSIGYSKMTKHNHIVELSGSFDINRQEEAQILTLIDSSKLPIGTSATITKVIVGTRFEYSVPILELSKRSEIYFGLSYEPYVFSYNSKPFTTADFTKSIVKFDNIIAITPRFIQNISRNCFLDINIPFPIFAFSIEHDYIANPILPTYARSKTSSSSSFAPSNYQVRVGLGIRL